MPRGVGYSYWSLCETYRTYRGPRQRVVASLGKLNEPEATGLAQGWADLSALLSGEPAAKSAPTPCFPALAPKPAAAPAWEQVDVRGVRVERSRDFGEVYLGLALWRRLKLDELMATLLPAGRESVDWGRVAALLTITRFCAQRSERGIAEHWYETTALDDLLGVSLELVNDDRLYRALDQLASTRTGSVRISWNATAPGSACVLSFCSRT